MMSSIPRRNMEAAWRSKVAERNSKWLCTWRNGWLKKTPLPSVSPAEFSAVCMSASLTNTLCNISRWWEKKNISANLRNTVFNDPVTTISTDMISSFVLSPMLFVFSHFQKWCNLKMNTFHFIEVFLLGKHSTTYIWWIMILVLSPIPSGLASPWF